VEQVATAECNLEAGIIHAVGKKSGSPMCFSQSSQSLVTGSSVDLKEQATPDPGTDKLHHLNQIP
jgi:hypothetical protein